MITLSIIIYVASPLDYARYRHAALYLENGERPEPPNANPNANTEATAYAKTNLNPNTEAEAETETPLQPKSSVLEIVGSTGFFTFAERLNWDIPTSSTDVARVIHVGALNEPGVSRTPLASATASPNRNRYWDRDRNVGGHLDSAPSIDPINSIRDIISKTPIRSNGDTGSDGEEDWNSQNWVGDALGRLVLAGYLGAHARDLGIERMIEAIMEAGDEESLV